MRKNPGDPACPSAGPPPGTTPATTRDRRGGAGRGRTLRIRRSPALLEDGVVPRGGVEHVVAGAADEDVIAGAADERVVAVAADEDVIPLAAVLLGRKGQADRGDDVVAAAGVDG